MLCEWRTRGTWQGRFEACGRRGRRVQGFVFPMLFCSLSKEIVVVDGGQRGQRLAERARVI